MTRFCRTYFSKCSSKCIWLNILVVNIHLSWLPLLQQIPKQNQIILTISSDFKMTKWFMTPKMYFLFMLVCTLVKHLRTCWSEYPQKLCPLLIPAVQEGVSALPLACKVLIAVRSRWARVRLSRDLHAGFMLNNTLSASASLWHHKGEKWQLFSHSQSSKVSSFSWNVNVWTLGFWAQKIHLFLSCKSVFFVQMMLILKISCFFFWY